MSPETVKGVPTTSVIENWWELCSFVQVRWKTARNPDVFQNDQHILTHLSIFTWAFVERQQLEKCQRHAEKDWVIWLWVEGWRSSCYCPCLNPASLIDYRDAPFLLSETIPQRVKCGRALSGKIHTRTLPKWHAVLLSAPGRPAPPYKLQKLFTVARDWWWCEELSMAGSQTHPLLQPLLGGSERFAGLRWAGADHSVLRVFAEWSQTPHLYKNFMKTIAPNLWLPGTSFCLQTSALLGTLSMKETIFASQKYQRKRGSKQ